MSGALVPVAFAKRMKLPARFCRAFSCAVATATDLAGLQGYAAVADRILFDAKAPKDATRPGGLGLSFDWRLLQNLDLKIPFMVSGGLDADNVADALRTMRADGVDVSSGVESAPGVKDTALIAAFFKAVSRAVAGRAA